MKKLTLILFVILLFSAGNLFAKIKITVTAPTTGDAVLDAQLAAGTSIFETKLQGSDLSSLGSQELLANGFGNASVYASQAATLAGYQGYDLFAVMIGLSGSVQIPDVSLSMDTPERIKDDIIRDKDIDAGVGFSAALNVGLNITTLKNMAGLDALLPNRLYANLKYSNLSRKIGDFEIETSTIGLGINYQLIDKIGIPLGVIKWSGISVGTGFYHTTSKVNFSFQFEEYISDSVGENAGTHYFMAFTPDTNFGINISSNIIPVDISTSIKLLWILNLSAGAGIDLTFGDSKIVIGSSSGMKVYSGNADKTGLTPITAATSGNARIDAGTKDTPTFANFRLAAGLGLCMGPIPVDFRLTYYPFTNGYALGVSTGIVW